VGAEKAFTKWLPGMFPTPVQSLAEVYSCTRDDLEEMTLKLCILFLINKAIPGIF